MSHDIGKVVSLSNPIKCGNSSGQKSLLCCRWNLHGEPTHDWQALRESKNKELQRLSTVYKKNLESGKVDFIEGLGKVVDEHTVEVKGKRYSVSPCDGCELCWAWGSLVATSARKLHACLCCRLRMPSVPPQACPLCHAAELEASTAQQLPCRLRHS